MLPPLPSSTLFPYTTLFRSFLSRAFSEYSCGLPTRLKLRRRARKYVLRSEEHTSELQSLRHLVCRLLLEKKHPCSIIPPRSAHHDASAQDHHDYGPLLTPLL